MLSKIQKINLPLQHVYGIPLTRHRRNQAMVGLMALEIVFAFSYLGFIVIPPISITTMHILVIVAGMLLGIRESLAVSIIFILSTIWQATVSGTQYSDLIFSPIISGIPLRSIVLLSSRIWFALLTGFLFQFYLKKKKNI